MVENWNDDDRDIGDWSSIVKYRSPLNSPIDIRNILKEIAVLEQNLIQEDTSIWIDYNYENVTPLTKVYQNHEVLDSDFDSSEDSQSTEVSTADDLENQEDIVEHSPYAYT